jgi:hypothetical protein
MEMHPEAVRVIHVHDVNTARLKARMEQCLENRFTKSITKIHVELFLSFEVGEKACASPLPTNTRL